MAIFNGKIHYKLPFSMGKSTISMAIFNSFLYVHQRVAVGFPVFLTQKFLENPALKKGRDTSEPRGSRRRGRWWCLVVSGDRPGNQATKVTKAAPCINDHMGKSPFLMGKSTIKHVPNHQPVIIYSYHNMGVSENVVYPIVPSLVI